MATVATDFNMQFTHFCNNPFWYCSHCGFRNDYTQKRCPSCFKLKLQRNKNKPIVVLDIDETLIASKDKNDKEISKEYLNEFVDQHANKLGVQYKQTMVFNNNVNSDNIDHLKVDFDGSPPPKLSPSILSTKSVQNDENKFKNFENFHKYVHDSGEDREAEEEYIGLIAHNHEHKLNTDDTEDDELSSYHLESSREPNPNRYLSPIKKRKRRNSTRTQPQTSSPLRCGENDNVKKPEHGARATIDISHFITKNDVNEYEPLKTIKKDMVYKSLTTKGKYYYIYFRSGAKQFVETLIGWKLCGHIQLCIMTAANKYYAKSILAKLLNCSKFESYFDCIISKEYLPFVRIQSKKTTNAEEGDKYRRIKALDIIYEQLDCDRSVKCVMIDDNLRNFDVYDKLMHVYNIVEYRNPLEARDRYLDNKLRGALKYIESIVIHKLNRNELIENELNNGYKQYLLHQSDDSLREKIQRLQERDANIEHKLLYHILMKKTETLNKKIKIVQEFVKKERELQGTTHPLNRNTAKYLDRLLSAINIASFEYLDRYLMSGLIRIKKSDSNAFKTESELLATIVLFYRLYFVVSNHKNTMKYFCSNFNAFLYNLYCCNVLIRYHLCNFDGRQFMKDCMQIFAGLTVVGADKRQQKENINNNDHIVVDIQKKFGKKIFYHYLQNVMYYVDAPYVFDSMFDKEKIIKLLPAKYRDNDKYTPYIQNQSEFFKVFEKYTSTLSVFIYKAFNSRILR